MFAGGYRGREVFETQYAVYSMAMSGREGLEEGDKILMPMSAFEKLSRMEVDYPMLFELNNEQLGKKTHCGVLEFTAEEGRIYLPFWMMQNLFVEQGTLVKLKNITLKKANFVKFRAQSVDFLDITDHRAVMEVSLRRYTCLTQGDMITMPYSGKNYELEVVEVKPDGKACIVETDVKIDFDEPVGYVQPNVRSRAESLADSDAAGGTEGGANGNASQRKAQCARSDSTLEEEAKAAASIFEAFRGNAQRIDGKDISADKAEAEKTGMSPAEARAARLARFESSSVGAGKEKEGEELGGTEEKEAQKAPARKSRVAGQFSTKKNSAQAFSGSANKL